MSSDSFANFTMTLVGFILSQRLVVFLLNLIFGAFFLLFLRSIPWLRRHDINFRWFNSVLRESDKDHRASLGALLRDYWPTQSCLSSNIWRLPALPLSKPSNSTPHDPELGRSPNKPKNPATLITPFVSTQPGIDLTESHPSTSKRDSMTTYASIMTPWRLEPLRHGRSFASDSTGQDDSDIMTASSNYHFADSHKELDELPPPSPTAMTHVNPESINADIAELGAAESQVSLIPGESEPAVADEEDQEPESASGRRRPPTYGTTFSGHSGMTLPVYQELEDDRMSVMSQTPTYRSTYRPNRSTTVLPRPQRAARPPLPRLPPPSGPLPFPPSSFTMSKY